MNNTTILLKSQPHKSTTLEFSNGSVTLNSEQYKVVTSPLSENQRILASAGSGKTTTITARIAYLVETYEIDPRRVLLVTFSRAAAEEMISRVRKLTGNIKLYAGTFHGLSAQILREHAPELLNDQPFIDELPYRLVKWLKTDKGIAWSARFRTVIVDEFQDINNIQWELLKCFHHKWATMTIVGDDAQNIYTWRGSSVNFILDFHKHIRNVRDYQLCRNYRSNESIVTIANSVMRFIPTLPFKEKMIANKRGGQRPNVHFFFRATEEYDWIVKMLSKLQEAKSHLTAAVISRYNHDLFKIEERLHKKGIPYNLQTHFDPEFTNTNKKRITLATIHASKGLEWDIVFFMNLHDDVFPSRKTDEEIVCERRLFYVGITRAKQALYLTYSRHERSLSRFVREIPRPFLVFHNVASFKLCTIKEFTQKMGVEDMINGLDGEDWNELRSAGYVPKIPETCRESIYKFGQIFSVPEWVKKEDVRESWSTLIKLIALRECALHLNIPHQLRTPEINEALLTLRIYKEDMEFWEEFEAEMEHLIHKFLKHTYQMPAVEYHQLEAYIKRSMPYLEWSPQDISKALIIIAKVRGQLRPLRHGGFNLKEFSFGLVRNSVPTELRPFVLSSWHKFIDREELTHNILGDVWRIAAINSVIEGRNIPLYQYEEILQYLVPPIFNTCHYFEQKLQPYESLSKDMLDITSAIEATVPSWISMQEGASINYIFEIEDVKPIRFDILTDKTVYKLCFDPKFTPSLEDKVLLLLKQYAYEEVYDKTLESIGFINLATGEIIKCNITKIMREQTKCMWEHLQRKYNLFQEALQQ